MKPISISVRALCNGYYDRYGHRIVCPQIVIEPNFAVY